MQTLNTITKYAGKKLCMSPSSWRYCYPKTKTTRWFWLAFLSVILLVQQFTIYEQYCSMALSVLLMHFLCVQLCLWLRNLLWIIINCCVLLNTIIIVLWAEIGNVRDQVANLERELHRTSQVMYCAMFASNAHNVLILTLN